MVLYLSLTAEVIDKATSETITTLATDSTKYATLRATNLKAFPPVNQLFTLQEPVRLYERQGDTVQTDKPHGRVAGPRHHRQPERVIVTDFYHPNWPPASELPYGARA